MPSGKSQTYILAECQVKMAIHPNNLANHCCFKKCLNSCFSVWVPVCSILSWKHFLCRHFFSKWNLNCPLDILSLLLGLYFCSTGPVLVWEKMQMSKATAGTVSLQQPKQTWHIQTNNLDKPCLISKQVLSSRHVGNVAVQISCMKKRQNKNQTQVQHPRPICFPLKTHKTLENTKITPA